MPEDRRLIGGWTVEQGDILLPVWSRSVSGAAGPACMVLFARPRDHFRLPGNVVPQS